MVRWDFGKCPIFSRTCVTASIAFATKLRASDMCPCSAGSVEAAKSACNFFSTSLRLSAQPSRRFSIRPSYRSHENLALRGLDCKQVFRGGFTMLASYRNRRRRNTGNCGLVLRVLLGCSRRLADIRTLRTESPGLPNLFRQSAESKVRRASYCNMPFVLDKVWLYCPGHGASSRALRSSTHCVEF